MEDSFLSIAITLGVFFTGQLVTAVWWGSKITNQVMHLNNELHTLNGKVDKLIQDGEKVTALEIRIGNLLDRLLSLERRCEKVTDESSH
jgi:hypothetical protein